MHNIISPYKVKRDYKKMIGYEILSTIAFIFMMSAILMLVYVMA